MSVSGFPVFPFIVSSIERIRIVQIMYGSYYLVEAMRGKVFADLFAAAFLHAYFYSFEYPERISFRSPEGMELRIYPVCFLLLGFLLASYLGLSVIAVSALGVILALILMDLKFGKGDGAVLAAADPDYDPLEDDDE